MSTAGLGKIYQQEPRMFVQMLVAFEEVVCDAGVTWFHRVYSGCILVQSWATEGSQDSSRCPGLSSRIVTWFPSSRLAVPKASYADAALQERILTESVLELQVVRRVQEPRRTCTTARGARTLCQLRSHLWGCVVVEPDHSGVAQGVPEETRVHAAHARVAALDRQRR